MHKARTRKRPQLVATGFFALDIVFGLDDPAPRFYAGGTCGNLVAGLALLGWESSAIARLANDAAGDFVRRDLKRWGVNINLLGLAPQAATPIVLEKIQLSKNGVPKHQFLWNCPDCGSYFPPFKAVLRTQLESLKQEISPPDVFFADRVSRSSVEMARHFANKGSLIYFEPSAAGDASLFREMLQLCHVLKYSAQRARSFSELLREHNAQLELETLGEDGLRFRTRRAFTFWHSVPAYEVKIKDTAGSGDWTSVGLIATLFAEGKRGLENAKKHDITAALENAQAFAALNCQFEGARGAMYHMSLAKFIEAVIAIQARKPGHLKQRRISLAHHLATSSVCPSCKPNSLARQDIQVQPDPLASMLPVTALDDLE